MKMNRKKLQLFLIISLLLNISLLFLIFVISSRKEISDVVVLKDFRSLSERDKENLKKTTNDLIVNDDNYLFLGDSITYKYDLDKYYPDMPVVNSGVNGNKTSDIMDDLKKRVYDYNPSKIFILIGTNQLKDQSNEEIFYEIVELTKIIHEERKYAHIYVESIYPVNENVDNQHTRIRKNSRIRKINRLLKDYFYDSYVDYIDIYSKLADDDGNLKEEYTVDALHLSDEGYEVVTDILKDYM